MTLEGFEHPGFDEESGQRRGRGGRRPARSAGGESRAPRSPASAASEQPRAAPDEAGSVQPLAGHRAARKPRGPASHGEPIRMGSAQSNVTPFSAARPAPRHRPAEDDDERVIGFGDHQPAFLLRPVRISRRG
jgi:hypothetical protein